MYEMISFAIPLTCVASLITMAEIVNSIQHQLNILATFK
jgi:hypothetical protein